MNLDLNYAKDVIRSEGQAILSLDHIINDSFKQAVEMIYNCTGCIIVSGMGKAGIIGQKISATMASTGTPSHFLHPAEAIHGDLGRIRENDILLVLSHGGETDEITRLINIVKELAVPVIAVTANCDSTLGKYSDVVLCMGKQIEACPLKVAPTVSTTCMLAIGDAIALTVMKARNFGVEDYVRFHPGGSLGRGLMTVEQSMLFKHGEKLPIATLGDSVNEMLNKTEKVKRHGAVMIVDKHGVLAGIITDADIRRLLADKKLNTLDQKVESVMTPNCKHIRSDALAAEATALFHKFRIDELPVVDPNNKPVGLIDVQDILAIKVVG